MLFAPLLQLPALAMRGVMLLAFVAVPGILLAVFWKVPAETQRAA